jgi:hypothetical protein
MLISYDRSKKRNGGNALVVYLYNMIAKLFKLKDVGGKGKGLFAKDLILKGTIMSFECTQCRRISKQDFESISTMEKSSVFKDDYRKADGSHLVPYYEIIYLNYSCNVNILDSGKDLI